MRQGNSAMYKAGVSFMIGKQFGINSISERSLFPAVETSVL
ncbi:MAG: hypothetical protein ACFNVZ_10465 [Prevotella melaninogenica]